MSDKAEGNESLLNLDLKNWVLVEAQADYGVANGAEGNCKHHLRLLCS